MHFLKLLFVDKWPRPEGNAWAARYFLVYVLPLAAIGLASLTGKENFPGWMLLITVVAVFLAVKTSHWQRDEGS